MEPEPTGENVLLRVALTAGILFALLVLVSALG